jgi:S-formylglutathione hydrolase FrmB
MRLFCAFLLLMTHTLAHAGRIETLDVFSQAMQKNIRSLIVVPSDYKTTTAERYKVVYLLHGWSGDFTGWLGDAPHLTSVADDYQFIFVFPDGGYDSWYLDSKVDTSVQYETYITRELIDTIDAKYHTDVSPSGRAICGLSMGGHGALYLALRNQGLFYAAGSICGGVDLRPFLKNDWDLDRILGSPRNQWKNWEDASVVHLVQFIKPESAPKMIIDCGYDDFFLPVNRSLHDQLIKQNIAHEYTERPGTHDSEYWCNALDVQLLFFAKAWGKR